MNLEINEPEIAGFAQKVRDIIADRARLQAEVTSLKDELTALRERLEMHEATIRDVQERLQG